MLNILAIGTALPDTHFDAETISEWTGASPEYLIEKVGVKDRYYLKEEETGLDLAVKACQSLGSKLSGLSLKDAQLLIYVTQTPDQKIPHMSASLQAALDLPNIPVFDLALGCSGYCYGLSVAQGMLSTLRLESALLVTCDPYSKIMRREDRGTIAVFGDGATATWLSTSKGDATVGKFDLGTEGKLGELLKVEGGGGQVPIQSIWRQGAGIAPGVDYSLHMDGRGIFNFVMKAVPLTIAKCLEKENLSIEDIDYFAFHQASKLVLDSLIKKCRLDPDKVINDLGSVGNTVSSTIPMVLSNHYETFKAEKSVVLCCGFGVGLSWGTVVVRF